MSKSGTYTFTTRLKTVHGSFTHTIIVVPDDIMDKLPEKGRVRAKGTFNKTPFALGIQYKKDGTRYFMVSAQLRRQAKLASGDPVDVSFRLVDAKVVDIPEELEAVLEQDDKAMKVWQTFTPGLQRGLAHYVNSVKNVDSRVKRALEIMEKAKYRQLHAQKNSKGKKGE